MTDSFDMRNGCAALSSAGQHALHVAGGLLSLCSPAGCLRQIISAALRFAVLGSAFDISPICLWFLAKNKAADAKRGFRDLRKQTLFINARKMGTHIDRVHRELTDADLEKITSTYHAWRSSPENLKLKTENSELAYTDIPGFCFSSTTEQIASHGHVLTAGRYVGAEEVEDDGESFEENMPRLFAELHAQFAESAKLEVTICANLDSLGFKT